MREVFNFQVQSKSFWKAVEPNLGVIAIIAVPGAFMLASAFAPAVMPSENKNVPSWVKDYDARPDGAVCRITDRRTGQEFVSEDGKEVLMPRGWPIEPIC